MFDPHGIGPSTSSYYSRNKGRVIQRKLADPVSEPLTRKKLLSYLPIMRLNGIVQTPILRNIVSNDPTFSFDDDTYLASGSTVTFTGSAGFNISKFYLEKDNTGIATINLSDMYYTASELRYEVGLNGQGGYILFIYLHYISNTQNYTVTVIAEPESEVTSEAEVIPSNSLYTVVHNVTYPFYFELLTSTGAGILASYTQSYGTDIRSVYPRQYFYFEDDRLGVN